ncbi:LytTR family DNA-binding domain-containing protein [Leucothrix arctica]|nr:LytTR family DNA-binding domain-containing protein [Leucothrix arctica]
MSGTYLKQDFIKLEEFWIVVLALLTAWTLAAHQDAYYAIFGVLGSYLYWTFRILIETAFLTAVLFAVEKYCHRILPTWARYVSAILLSLIPFTLAITALDLVMGLPELGLDSIDLHSGSRGWAFGLELFYLLDNHIILSVILLLPRLLLQIGSQVANVTESDLKKETTAQASFFDSINPPLDGRVYCMEAQEHYISITTSDGNRMVLHRFSDAVKQTPSTLGMQVHRSHWVAHAAVKDVVIEGQSMKLKLIDDKEVPVSRSFRTTVDKQLNN